MTKITCGFHSVRNAEAQHLQSTLTTLQNRSDASADEDDDDSATSISHKQNSINMMTASTSDIVYDRVESMILLLVKSHVIIAQIVTTRMRYKLAGLLKRGRKRKQNNEGARIIHTHSFVAAMITGNNLECAMTIFIVLTHSIDYVFFGLILCFGKEICIFVIRMHFVCGCLYSVGLWFNYLFFIVRIQGRQCRDLLYGDKKRAFKNVTELLVKS